MISYLAGFFDGEGCISVNSNGSIQLRVINTSKKVLDKFPEEFGGKVLPRKQIVNKPQYHWSIYGEDAINAAVKLLPFCIEKKSQLETILSWWKERENFKIREGKVRGVQRDNIQRDLKIKSIQEQLTKLKKEY